MPDPHDTTADHPPRELTTVNESSPDSFIPGKRVIEESSGAEIATERAGSSNNGCGPHRSSWSSVSRLFFARSLVLHWHRLESRTVLFHGIMLGLLLLSLRRSLQPMEADVASASVV